MQLASKNLAADMANTILRTITLLRKRFSSTDGLLVTTTNSYFWVDRFLDREGAYLYHDPRRSQFIQSGKRTGGYKKS